MQPPDRTRPSISVIIPAYNEEEVIGPTLARVRQVLDPHELIVVNATSTDRTAEIAAQKAHVETVKMTRGGGLNHAASLAGGELLLFLHADTLLPSDAAAGIECAFREPAIVAAAFRLRLDDPGILSRVVSGSVNLRSGLLNSFFGDQGLVVRREAFLACGGYRDWSVMEDLEILSRLRKRGKLALLDAAVVTSARRHQGGGWLRTVATVWLISLLFRLGMPAQHLTRLYPPRR